MSGFFRSKLKKIMELSPAEKRFCLRAAFRLTLIKLYLKIFPYRKVLEKTRRSAERSAASQRAGEIGSLPSPEELGILLEKCARNLPFTFLCLPVALAGYVLFRRLGLDADLKIGAKQSSREGFFAHAWVELDGRVLVGDLPDLGSYALFDSRQEFPG